MKLSKKSIGRLLKGAKVTTLLTAAGGLVVGTYNLVTYIASENKDPEQLAAVGVSYTITLASLGTLWKIIKFERKSLEDQLPDQVELHDQYGRVARTNNY